MPDEKSLTIRPGTDADGPALRDLIAGVFAEYEGCPFVDEEFPELSAPATHFGSRQGRLWVVEDGDGRLTGSLAVAATHREGVFELFKVYVAAAHRGKGVARRLLDGAVEHVRERNGRRIVLWSDTRFVDGHRFYLRNGFLRMPGTRALHDAATTLEFNFAREMDATAGSRP